MSHADGGSRLRILLVGASDYPSLSSADRQRVPKLSGDNDVVLLKSIFQSRFAVPDDQIKVMVETNELTRSGILRAVKEWLIDGAKAGDALVFWWSGHGTKVTLGSPNQTAMAIVPPGVRLVNPSTVDSSTLIFARELRSLFTAAKAKGVKDVTWFLDSCYSGVADRGEGLDRFLAVGTTPPSPEQIKLPESDDEDPKDWVIVSAGGQDQVVKQVKADNGQWLGPLTYSILEIGARLGPDTTYLQLGHELRRVALELRSERVPEVRGAVNRALFGGYVQWNRWVYPVVEPGNSSVGLDSIGWTAKLDPSLPSIPVGQLHGIRTGMRFQVRFADRSQGFYEVARALATVSQLKPLEGPPRTTYKGASATLFDSTGESVLTFALGDGLSLSAEQVKTLESSLAAYPFVKLLAPGAARYTLSASAGQIGLKPSTGGAMVPVAWTPGDLVALAEYVKCQAQAELIRSMAVVGPQIYRLEAEAVQVQKVSAMPEKFKVFPGESPKEPLNVKQDFAVRVRVGFDAETLRKIKSEDGVAAPMPGSYLYVYCIEVEPNGQHGKAFPLNRHKPFPHYRDRAFPPSGDEDSNRSRIELPTIGLSGWFYLGIGGFLIPEAEIQLAADLGMLRVFRPLEFPGDQGVYTLKVIVSPQDQDFVQLLKSGSKGTAKPRGVGWAFSMLTEDRSGSRGVTADTAQDSAMSTLSFRVRNGN